MNVLYSAGKDAILTGQLDWVTDPIVGVLVNVNYVPQAQHASLADVPSVMRVAVSGTLSNRTVTNGVFRADALTVYGVYGDTVGAIVLVKQTGTELTSTLLSFLNSSADLPVLPNGGDLIFNWDPGTFGVFAVV